MPLYMDPSFQIIMWQKCPTQLRNHFIKSSVKPSWYKSTRHVSTSMMEVVRAVRLMWPRLTEHAARRTFIIYSCILMLHGPRIQALQPVAKHFVYISSVFAWVPFLHKKDTNPTFPVLYTHCVRKPSLSGRAVSLSQHCISYLTE